MLRRRRGNGRSVADDADENTHTGSTSVLERSKIEQLTQSLESMVRWMINKYLDRSTQQTHRERERERETR